MHIKNVLKINNVLCFTIPTFENKTNIYTIIIIVNYASIFF